MQAIPWSDLAVGATVLLALGALISLATSSPHERHRVGTTTALALLCWFGLALAPLPRFGEETPAAVTPATGTPTPARVEPTALVARPSVDPAIVDDVVTRHATEPLPAPATGAPSYRLPSLDLTTLLPRIWAVGSIAALLFLVFGHALLRRILRRAAEPDASLSDLARQLWPDASAPPVLRVSTDAPRPFCCGFLRPTVVVPQALCVPQLRGGLAHILRHEFAHVRRGDLRTQALFTLALLPFWWHPLLWWLRARSRFAAELVADEVAATSSAGRRAYARNLVEVAGLVPRDARSPIPALSVFERESDFSRRMQMLLARNDSLTVHSRAPVRLTRAALTLLAIVGATGLYGRPALSAQDPVRTQARAKDPNPLETIRVLQTLNSVTLEHRFQSATLEDVAAFYARLSSLNIVIDPSVMKLGAERTTIQDFGLDKCTVADALDAITTEMGIHWGVRDGIVLIDTHEVRAGQPDELLNRLGVMRDQAAADRGMDFDLLCKMLGDTGENLRAAVGDTSSGTREIVVTDLIMLLRRQNETLAKQLQARITAGQGAPSHDLGAIADLVTRAIDARGEVRTAEAAATRLRPLAKAAMVSQSDVAEAESRLRAAAEKHQAFHALVTSELEAIVIELDAAKAELGGLTPESPRRSTLESHVRRLTGYAQVLDSAR